jgi:hypothetical protein
MDIFEQLGIDRDTEETESTPPLVFSKGGKLTYNEWVYDEEKGEGQYIPRDITENLLWTDKRGKQVAFTADVTLDDVFQFLAKEPEICDVIFDNCFIKDYVAAWKKVDRSKIVWKQEYHEDGIEYLHVYWAPDLFTYAGKTEISGLSRACFDGQGFELQEDKYEDEEKTYVLYKKGHRINWGIDFSALETLLGLPVVLNTQFKIVKEWQRGMDLKEIRTILDVHREFTFHEAIEAIMWEISFYGIEEDKLIKAKEIGEMRDSIDWDSLKDE